MRKIIFLFSMLFLSSCAGYNPAVDPQTVSNTAKYDRDVEECRELARQNTGITDTAKSVAKNILIAGAIGAGTGTLLGVIAGETAKGLATGAVIGGAAGGVKGAYESDKEYETIFRNCMGVEDIRFLTKSFQSIKIISSDDLYGLSR